MGVFGATVGALFAAFPRELVQAIAGLALFGTIAGGLATAMKDEAQREPALITFLVTASGLNRLGLLWRGGRLPGAAGTALAVSHLERSLH